MKLLNSKNIYKCNEEEVELHNDEIFEFIEKLSDLDNYECAILAKYQDKVNKDKPTKILNLDLYNLKEVFEMFDCKNGVDLFLDEEYFVLLLYGQMYTYNFENYMLTLALKILPYNENRDFLDITQFILKNEVVKIASNQLL